MSDRKAEFRQHYMLMREQGVSRSAIASFLGVAPSTVTAFASPAEDRILSQEKLELMREFVRLHAPNDPLSDDTWTSEDTEVLLEKTTGLRAKAREKTADRRARARAFRATYRKLELFGVDFHALAHVLGYSPITIRAYASGRQDVPSWECVAASETYASAMLYVHAVSLLMKRSNRHPSDAAKSLQISVDEIQDALNLAYTGEERLLDRLPRYLQIVADVHHYLARL